VPLLQPLLGAVAIAMEPEGAELLGAVSAKAGEHGIEALAVLLPRQGHQGSEGRGWIEWWASITLRSCCRQRLLSSAAKRGPIRSSSRALTSWLRTCAESGLAAGREVVLMGLSLARAERLATRPPAKNDQASGCCHDIVWRAGLGWLEKVK